MTEGVVIGGGRWGRAVAGKLSSFGYRMRVATDFPQTPTDIRRQEIGALDPVPALVYVASKSSEHATDFERVAGLGTRVWVEKNFSHMPDALIARFLSGDNFIFNQQLFNTSADRYAALFAGVSEVEITTEVDRPMDTVVGLFDWICHDLALIARVLWLRGDTRVHTVDAGARWSGDACAAQVAVNGMQFRVTLSPAARKRRTIELGAGGTLVAGNDGVLWHRTADGQTDCPDPSGTTNDDLLGASLRVAVESPAPPARVLTELVVALQRALLPHIEALDYPV